MASKKPPTTKAWITQIFQAAQAQKAGVLRRSAMWVLRYASEKELVDAAKARGFIVIRIGDQYVVVCNTNAVVLVQP